MWIQSLRPKQWCKNFFLFAPLIFSTNLFHIDLVLKLCLGFISFSLIASSVYILNDLMDYDQDKNHPQKKKRPIASGALPKNKAYILMTAIFLLGFIVSCFLGVGFFTVIISYFFLNVVYSTRLKYVAIIDVLIVAFGYVLRIIAGGVICNIALSSWILVCTMFLALFISLCKRRSELVIAEKEGGSLTVPHLYNKYVIDQFIATTASLTIIAYALYTIDQRTMSHFNTQWLIGTTIFVIYGVFRYQYLHYTLGETENPTEIVTRDKGLIINMLLWILMVIILIYGDFT